MRFLLSIGRFAQLTRISVSALRFYGDVKLLEPALIDPDSSYRYYDPEQVALAERIAALRSVDLPLEQTLAFVLREAVTNAIRHANASRLWVSLERAGEKVRLSIWDDGSERILEGNGIRGMRERVQALGGSLELDAKGKGVTALVGG